MPTETNIWDERPQKIYLWKITRQLTRIHHNVTHQCTITI